MTKLNEMLMDPGIAFTPGSLTGKAINYFLKNWTPATAFLKSGALPLDNSIAERVIRSFTIGRNNWMAAGSENGARWMAILYTIISTCKLNGIDIQAYLVDVLMRLPLRPEGADLSDLTPLGWYMQKHNGKRPPVNDLYQSKH